MKFPRKATISVASVKRNRFDLSSQTICTNDFGFLKPVLVRNTYPNESYHCNPEYFCRTAPMPVPTFGRLNLHYDTFFVPFYQIYKDFNNVLTGASVQDSSGTVYQADSFPYFTYEDIFKACFCQELPVGSGFFYNNVPYISVESDGSIEGHLVSDEYMAGLTGFAFNVTYKEFVESIKNRVPYVDSNGVSHEWIFGDYVTHIYTNGTGQSSNVTGYEVILLDARTKHFVDLFYSLGYGINFLFPGTPSSDTTQGTWPFADTTRLNALRFVAFLKIYVDWYENAQFTQDSVFRRTLEKFCDLHGSTIHLDWKDMKNFQDGFFRSFENDMFSSSYVTPDGLAISSNLISQGQGSAIPTNLTHNTISMTGNNASQGAIISQDTVDSEGNFVSYLHQSSLNLLSKVQEFIARFRVGGQKDIDRYLTEFGVKSDSVDKTRSVLINSYSSALQVSDVTSLADTENNDGGSSLGSYAGKAMSFGSNQWNCDIKDFGVIMTIQSIVPVVGYPYGREKETEIKKLTDLYTPEYDCVGVEALSFSHLALMDNGLVNPNKDSIFGYVPRYSHMKVGNDILSGDFRFRSLSTGLDSWHLFRNLPLCEGKNDFSRLANDETFRKINAYIDLVTSRSDYPFLIDKRYINPDFDRIFDVVDTREDHFYLICNFNLSAERSMKSISDFYDLEHPVDESEHNKISVDFNGNQL